jgi:hypothetical protein
MATGGLKATLVTKILTFPSKTLLRTKYVGVGWHDKNLREIWVRRPYLTSFSFIHTKTGDYQTSVFEYGSESCTFTTQLPPNVSDHSCGSVLMFNFTMLTLATCGCDRTPWLGLEHATAHLLIRFGTFLLLARQGKFWTWISLCETTGPGMGIFYAYQTHSCSKLIILLIA